MSCEHPSHELVFVTCANSTDVLNRRLLASPCLQSGRRSVATYWNCKNAAEAFNAMSSGVAAHAQWLVWVHQDVFLPGDWDLHFLSALRSAQTCFPRLAVAGVYGLLGAGPDAKRAGHVLDRGRLLREPTQLPTLANSLDELLFAVKVNSRLLLDPELGFDLYATDLVLQADDAGFQSVIIDAYCEHWSDTPATGPVAPHTARRIRESAQVFERKWAHRFPISTPCFEIAQIGDVARFIDSLAGTHP